MASSTFAPSDPPPLLTRRWTLLLLALAAFLSVNLGGRGLNDPDEGRYANIALEMAEGPHGWWEPRMSDFAHYDKPPLTYWVTLGCFEVFGRTEWAARLPCLLGAVLALAGLGWTAFRWYGERTAWWAVLFCGTAGQFWLLARLLTPDMLLTGFCTAAIACWAEARHRGRPGVWWWLGAGFWVLAWWTKATAALVPLLGLCVGLRAVGDQTGWRVLRAGRLLIVVLVAGAPWYVSMVENHPELRAFFLGREVFGRIAGHPDGRHGPAYYHLALSLLAWAPWWPWTLAWLAKDWRRWRERLRSLGRRALPWEGWLLATGLGVFSLISSKLPTYTLPFAPWAALLCARALPRREAGAGAGLGARPLFGVALAWAGVLVAGSFLAPRVESSLGPNSSLREVASFLRERGAERVYLDRYMPSVEFYFGEQVFYVTDRVPRQRADDPGWCRALGEPHFVPTAELPAHLRAHPPGNVWFVRYQRRKHSPLAAAAKRHSPPLETVRVGDFVLERVEGARMARGATGQRPSAAVRASLPGRSTAASVRQGD